MEKAAGRSRKGSEPLRVNEMVLSSKSSKQPMMSPVSHCNRQQLQVRPPGKAGISLF